jgi:glutathione peroxidase
MGTGKGSTGLRWGVSHLKKLLFGVSVVGSACMGLLCEPQNAAAEGAGAQQMTTVLTQRVQSIDGVEKSLGDYKGSVLLIVNVASFCGYTPQYAGLESLYQRYKGRGLYVLGFPSNDFGQQEPGTESEIKRFCSERFGVTFPLFAKTKVLGRDKSPLYALLTAQTGGAEVSWNFEKFLVSRSGAVVGRFASGVTPEARELTTAIEAALAQ